MISCMWYGSWTWKSLSLASTQWPCLQKEGPQTCRERAFLSWKCLLKALIPLFHCQRMWHWEMLSSPPFSVIARPSCFSYIDCGARLSSPSSLLLCCFTHRQLGTRRLFPCLCICPTQQACPSCCPTGQVERLYKPHIRHVSEENKENFCICGFLSFRFHF